LTGKEEMIIIFKMIVCHHGTTYNNTGAIEIKYT